MRKRVAVIVGRFQPPTIGHYKVVDVVKAYIRKHDLGLLPVPVVAVIAGEKSSEDKQRNPLTGAERVTFMKSSGRCDGVKFIVANDVLSAFKSLRDDGFEPVVVAAGSDRAGAYVKILDKYFPDVEHYSIEVERDTAEGESLEAILTHLDADVPVHLVSASLARLAVKKDDLKKFEIITGLSTKLAKIMFDKIKARA